MPQYSTLNSSRFTCQCTKHFGGRQCQNCAKGYTGHMCQTPIRSCKDYKDGGESGKIYKVFSESMKLYPVLCDFDKDRAWTLIQSFKLENHGFYKASFASNRPNNISTPNFEGYRLSKKKMLTVAQNSSKWRITCDYRPGEKISYTDYVETSLEKLDLVTFNGNRYGMSSGNNK